MKPFTICILFLLFITPAMDAQSIAGKYIRVIKPQKDSLPVLKPGILTQLEELTAVQQKKTGNLCLLVSSSDRQTAESISRWLSGRQQLDIYQVHLSGVVSKYIGETEKNLELLFSKAATQKTILLFDEADALFGKRSNPEESSDQEKAISYFIKQLAACKGPVVIHCAGEDCSERFAKARLTRISG